MENNINFGSYLKEIRISKKYSIRKLELKTGISNAYLSQLENGKRGIPSIQVLKQISVALEVPFQTLLDKAGYPIESEVGHLDYDWQAFIVEMTSKGITPDKLIRLVREIEHFIDTNNT